MESKKRVLLVDDDSDVLVQMRKAVEKKYLVKAACSGEECLKSVNEERPDLIVMDVMMSTLSDGLDTAKKLKESPDTRDIPIIMLTGVNDVYDYRTQTDDAYFPKDKWLDKPVEPDILLKEIDALLG